MTTPTKPKTRAELLAALDAIPLEKIERDYRASIVAAKAARMKDSAANSRYYQALFMYETKMHRVKKGLGS